MSIAQIEKISNKLSAQERTYLRVYLAALERIDRASFKADVTRRRREMSLGHFVSSKGVKRLHRRLESKGL